MHHYGVHDGTRTHHTTYNINSNSILRTALIDFLEWSTTGGASDIVKAKSSGEDPRATGGLVSNLPHPWVNKTKQHTHCVHDVTLTYHTMYNILTNWEMHYYGVHDVTRTHHTTYTINSNTILRTTPIVFLIEVLLCTWGNTNIPHYVQHKWRSVRWTTQLPLLIFNRCERQQLRTHARSNRSRVRDGDGEREREQGSGGGVE